MVELMKYLGPKLLINTNKITRYPRSVPLHSVMPSPSNPCLHLQVNEPSVLMQSAVLWQGDPSHSLLSDEKYFFVKQTLYYT